MALITLKADKEEMALVQLALQFSKKTDGTLMGDLPTEEELASLYENRLDATRRAQILSFIANSSVIHERWIRCVESLVYMDKLNNVNAELADSAIEESVNLIQRITNWMLGLLTNRQVIGGGLSTAVVLVLVLYMLPFQRDIDIDMQIDSTYAGWGRSLESEWSALPTSKKPQPQYSTDRSFFLAPKKKSTIQQVLESGFKVSMSQIGAIPFKDYGIEITSLSSVTDDDVSNALTVSQYMAIRQIGQLSALAAMQCKINPNSERIAELSPVFVQLRKQLTDNPFENSAALVAAMGTKIDLIACSTAQHVIDQIIE